MRERKEGRKEGEMEGGRLPEVCVNQLIEPHLQHTYIHTHVPRTPTHTRDMKTKAA